MKRYAANPLSACAAIGLASLPATALCEERGLFLPYTPDQAVSIQSDRNDRVQPEALLRVYVGPKADCCEGRTPLAGRYREINGLLSFEPAFPFLKGQAYTVERTGNEPTIEFTLGRDVAQEAPVVAAISPGGTAIPENTLRFYIHFNQPMQPHRASEFISLRNAVGVRDDAAFMLFKQELWNEDRTQLTLLMDPGRIKRGVAQNTLLGPALTEGLRYSIVIEEGWPTAFDGRVTPRFEKIFRASSALRTLPDPANWSISRPRSKSRDQLNIAFDRPFDQQSTTKSIRFTDATGAVIKGRITLFEDHTGLRFEPSTDWSGTHFNVVIDANLEDVAGNNFRELLDHELDDPSTNATTVMLRQPLAK